MLDTIQAIIFLIIGILITFVAIVERGGMEIVILGALITLCGIISAITAILKSKKKKLIKQIKEEKEKENKAQ